MTVALSCRWQSLKIFLGFGETWHATGCAGAIRTAGLTARQVSLVACQMLYANVLEESRVSYRPGPVPTRLQTQACFCTTTAAIHCGKALACRFAITRCSELLHTLKQVRG